MAGLFVNLKNFFSLGQSSVEARPSLGEFALNYQLDGVDDRVRAGWQALQFLFGDEHLERGLNGLRIFLDGNRDEELARVCFSADCEVGFEINNGSLTIDPHDGSSVSCSTDGMIGALESVFNAYDMDN